jgi:hypothetical protein
MFRRHLYIQIIANAARISKTSTAWIPQMKKGRSDSQRVLLFSEESSKLSMYFRWTSGSGGCLNAIALIEVEHKACV